MKSGQIASDWCCSSNPVRLGFTGSVALKIGVETKHRVNSRSLDEHPLLNADYVRVKNREIHPRFPFICVDLASQPDQIFSDELAIDAVNVHLNFLVRRSKMRRKCKMKIQHVMGWIRPQLGSNFSQFNFWNRQCQTVFNGRVEFNRVARFEVSTF